METYIVRQPILDQSKEIFAYEILWHQTLENSGGEDAAAATAIEDIFYQISGENDSFLNGRLVFVTLTPNLLLKNIPNMFDPGRLVIQIDDSVIINSMALKAVYRFHQEGYRIAIKGFEFASRYFGVLDVVDYIKVDFASCDLDSISNISNMGRGMGKILVAENINAPDSNARATALGFQYVQGAEVAQQFTSRTHRLDHMQSNFFQLMVAITKDEPDVDEIVEIISRDVTLAFSLIKLVNSAYFALRNRVKSVKQALIVLGLGQLKEWIYLLSFKEGSSDYPEELMRMSFLRARFCWELAPYIPDLPMDRAEAYLMGMFSTLGALLDVPLEKALGELALSDELKQALLTGEGPCGNLYELVKCYEKADWKGLTIRAKRLGIPMNVITQKYFQCVEYVGSIWKDLTSSGEEE